MIGPVEGSVQVATGFVDSLKNQPLSLALVVMNLVLLAYMYYETSTVHASRLETVKLVLTMQKEVQELLARCIIPERPQRSDTIVPLPLPRPLDAPTPPPVAIEEPKP